MPARVETAAPALRPITAGAVIRDEAGRVLLVETSYRPDWLTPGGSVEAGESPREAAAREVREELGVALSIGRPLVMQWAQEPGDDHGVLHLAYDGGVVDASTPFRLEPGLASARFVAPAAVQALASATTAARVEAALRAIASGASVELPEAASTSSDIARAGTATARSASAPDGAQERSAHPQVVLRSRFAVDDAVLSRLHAEAFGGVERLQPWAARLERHGVAWIGAFEGAELVGFVHACGDGGAHAFLLDAVVRSDRQGRGIGRRLVDRLVREVRAVGCEWLHVDHEPQLARLYRACGFRPTAAGVLRLDAAEGHRVGRRD
ncbi:GNAT family N-acetyltransferase [Amnibacterium endophyticum]|uniref:GNAT family N-acetyltransferase n=1 Tax=Amnibacterium endophyticum TaxID=2109337 RepID=A0ABW4LGN0_9MICO